MGENIEICSDERRGLYDITNMTKLIDACTAVHGDKTYLPAKGKQCSKCNKYNNFAKVCKAVCEMKLGGYSDYSDSSDDQLTVCHL